MISTEDYAPTTAEDDQVAAEVAAVLATSCYHELRQVSCQAHGKRVILVGQVSSFYYKQLAQSHVQAKVGAAVTIENHLNVSNDPQ